MKQGLYIDSLEKDACGIGLICNIRGRADFSIVDRALTMLENMEHRGANGCEPNTGDGAGILVQLPHDFFKSVADLEGIDLPPQGSYAVGSLFLPTEQELRDHCLSITSALCESHDFNLFWIRYLPVDDSMLGHAARISKPCIAQIFIQNLNSHLSPFELEQKLYVLRNKITRKIVRHYDELKEVFYFCSLSSLTLVYKGQLKATQLRPFYADLRHPAFATSMAIVHSRFSTNTTPKWKLAQPFRMIAHNGEINTIEGNVRWWKAREQSLLRSLGGQTTIFHDVFPVCAPTLSDSANFDGVLEFLSKSQFDLTTSLMAMIPKAWHYDQQLEKYKKDFYEFHEYLIEPWDGPASMIFTDGFKVGATIDRNGLRPSRFWITNNDDLILCSESGAVVTEAADIVKKGNLSPGNILVIDLQNHTLIDNTNLEDQLGKRSEFTQWLEQHRIQLKDIPPILSDSPIEEEEKKMVACGFSKEDRDLILQSMSNTGKEAIGSMGSDIPLAVLSHKHQHLSNYFKQNFAQVTNPPIDPLREHAYMSLASFLGRSISLSGEAPNDHTIIRLPSPLLTAEDYQRILNVEFHGLTMKYLDCTFQSNNTNNLEEAIHRLRKASIFFVESGADILILDNTNIQETSAAIPAMMAVGAVHHALIDAGLRKKVSLLAVAADVIEVHHLATTVGYGADAVFPALVFQYLNRHEAGSNLVENYAHAMNAGLYKIMSKLGVSTILSYKGAQAFEALGISSSVIDLCFKGTISRIEGMTFDQLAKEIILKHQIAFQPMDLLPDEGRYQWKKYGEYHLFNPQTIHLLQHATSTNNYEIFKKYTEAANLQDGYSCTLRSLLQFKPSTPIPVDEVESVEQIMKRFATGAMSFGSISEEAHTTLAIAMNRIGGKSNSGEGGEDPARYQLLPNGDNPRSAIKQVASGRFGVNIEYLVNADELQIKMSQGAKPGEGGQLPGSKVDDTIARIRHSMPGIGLISPPPHHDIYSIEDLAQLIFDLKNANENARISVKLVSKAGVGIIASGVAKGHADHILISGFDGGTGASPLSSIMHAGLPWELGLAETHQTLMKNGLRDRVTLQADGQIRTGRDLAMAVLLGAEEWGIATAALVVSGCILMRKCHLNNCPVGIATQNLTLRKKYTGNADHLVNYFRFLAMELREIMASLGFRTIQEMVGRSDKLMAAHSGKHWKYDNLDLKPILFQTEGRYSCKPYKAVDQPHGLEDVLDRKLIRFSDLAISDQIEINSVFAVKNTNRAVGTMLSSHITKKYGPQGLLPGKIHFHFKGSAGQSFGAFLTYGLNFTLTGEANDYFGKGLCGGNLTVIPNLQAQFEADKNIIIGNVALFGATSGSAYICGRAGERFAVRNSGAMAVVEGVGDNGCEYMTGGLVIILGEVGSNFAAGMSGGLAFVFDKSRKINSRLNQEMVSVEPCSEDDLLQLRQQIRAYFKATSSKKALKILLNWEHHKKWFKKIMPDELRSVLAKQPTSAQLVTSKISS